MLISDKDVWFSPALSATGAVPCDKAPPPPGWTSEQASQPLEVRHSGEGAEGRACNWYSFTLFGSFIRHFLPICIWPSKPKSSKLALGALLLHQVQQVIKNAPTLGEKRCVDDNQHEQHIYFLQIGGVPPPSFDSVWPSMIARIARGNWTLVLVGQETIPHATFFDPNPQEEVRLMGSCTWQATPQSWGACLSEESNPRRPPRRSVPTPLFLPHFFFIFFVQCKEPLGFFHPHPHFAWNWWRCLPSLVIFGNSIPQPTMCWGAALASH